ncbi:MAG: DUF4192 domain-containing protein [Actinomycetota bacterium]|nr:DUF4192 domain-containing protein [Actinomycetota bacterium]MDP1877504.1 DUF4192 domain-containing protein [Actinomycetota bacterium]
MSDSVITSAGRLTLSSPDAFLASIPHMIGFPPEDSIVIVGLAPDHTGAGSTVRVTQRFDRPPAGIAGDEARQLAAQAAEPMIRSGSIEVIIAVFADQYPEPDRELPDAALVDALITALDDGGVGIRDALYTDGTSRWSYGCDNPSCCPPTGRVISEKVRTLVAAEFALAGSAMVDSREVLAAEVAPADAAARAQVADCVRAAEQARDDALAAPGTSHTTDRPTRAREDWREQSITQIAALTSGEPASPQEFARVAVGLGDIRVRDTVLWDLMQPSADPPAAIAGLTNVVRHAPDGHVAPAATVLAICHWTSGDGARANAALQRADDDNPDYSLAALVRTSLSAGLPPQSWRDALADLTRDTCRHGEPPRTPQPAAGPVVASPHRRASIAASQPGLAL